MQNNDVLSIMQRQIGGVLRQVERAQADAASLCQWYAAIGSGQWANQVTDAEWLAAGTTAVQFKRAMADLAKFPAILKPTAADDLQDAPYKVMRIG